jgi:membrane protein DedA with SNARE-associated domain
MHLFIDYIEPLTAWLHVNPKMALFFTFLISCAESLAIIGSIVPGSLTMTAIGILAGSGVMRIDLTLFAASIGALAGDGVSYCLGYIYSDRLIQFWPFSKYPGLLNYGKAFFIKHGGKSVIIGRFIGPLRSIIPVIAGIMNMSKFQFFFANLISAIGWSILYVMPGYFVGAASNQLSTDGARRLFGLIILSLVVLWVTSKLVHWLIRTINRWYNNHLDTIYAWSIKHPYIKLIFRSSVNKGKGINGFAISLLILCGVCLISAILISIFVLQNTWINQFNSPISFFFQGIRTKHIDILFIIVNLLTSPLPILSAFFILLTATLYARNWRLLRYLISLAITSSITIYLISSNIDVPNYTSLYQLNIDATFPIISLTWTTSLFSFIICYLIEFCRKELSYSLLRAVLIIILMLSGISSIYLGDNWLTSVVASYCIGLAIGTIHWLLFQRQKIIQHNINFAVIIVITSLVLTTWLEFSRLSETIISSHSSKPTQYKLSESNWWHQEEPILPMFTTNRVGQQIGLFNLQYLGSIKDLEKKLTKFGWTRKYSSIFYSLMIRLDGKHSEMKLPIMEQLFLNKRPELIMIYNTDNNNNFYILRIWKSNYHVKHHKEPIWIGSIILATNKQNPLLINKNIDKTNNSTSIFAPLFPAIHNYRIIRMSIGENRRKPLRHVLKPKLLIFKDVKPSRNCH